jgi:hypothetical protein
MPAQAGIQQSLPLHIFNGGEYWIIRLPRMMTTENLT